MALETASGADVLLYTPSAEELLLEGKAPGRGSLVRELSAGIGFLADFWADRYLKEYIASGGSKIKFITGKTGSGKSHFQHLFCALAAD